MLLRLSMGISAEKLHDLIRGSSQVYLTEIQKCHELHLFIVII